MLDLPSSVSFSQFLLPCCHLSVINWDVLPLLQMFRTKLNLKALHLLLSRLVETRNLFHKLSQNINERSEVALTNRAFIDCSNYKPFVRGCMARN